VKSPLARAVLAGLALAALAAPAVAQISPGPLSRAHAKLEGSTRCLDCHDPKEGVSAGKCLACHEPLAKRIAAGKGLHARAEYRDCRTCHVEHQGKEFALVYWGKPGQAAFDHSLTGHKLAGRHAKLACAECHKTSSFLGAVAECGSCHRDEHRGQFAGRACTACHREDAWKPAPGFDHSRTAFALTGRHASVTCERCHAGRRPDPKAAGVTYRVFKVSGQHDCAGCHQDVHKGRLGSACTTCHNTGGWRSTRIAASFDHDRTGYPLAGRHRALACDACHKPGRPMRLQHERCGNCHEDAHAGQLAKRADAGRCESCHTVQEFRPARYGPEEHARTAFPLRGAHLAVACDECHRSSPGAASPAGLRLVRASVNGASRVALALPGRQCVDCHADPHRGEAGRVSAKAGCETCHRVESWREVGFDHAQTRYPLIGRHQGVACARCHVGAASVKAIGFGGAATECSACHRDPHDGQFTAAGQTACERCHATDSLRASRFLHARDSRYALDGAHALVPCAACHKPDNRGVVRYKPLPVACAGCHRADRTAANGGVR
jgi:hypothetical protein